jgi:hypothetical protein
LEAEDLGACVTLVIKIRTGIFNNKVETVTRGCFLNKYGWARWCDDGLSCGSDIEEIVIWMKNNNVKSMVNGEDGTTLTYHDNK